MRNQDTENDLVLIGFKRKMVCMIEYHQRGPFKSHERSTNAKAKNSARGKRRRVR